MINSLDAVLNTAIGPQTGGRKDNELTLVEQGKLRAELGRKAIDLKLNNVVSHPPIDNKMLSIGSNFRCWDSTTGEYSYLFYGASPNKFFDYISAGLPVINNYLGWLAGKIEQTQCGFVVQPDAPNSLSDDLEKAANHKEALTLMSANARQLAKGKFDRELLADKWVDWVTGVNAEGGNTTDSLASEVKDETTV